MRRSKGDTHEEGEASEVAVVMVVVVIVQDISHINNRRCLFQYCECFDRSRSVGPPMSKF